MRSLLLVSPRSWSLLAPTFFFFYIPFKLLSAIRNQRFDHLRACVIIRLSSLSNHRCTYNIISVVLFNFHSPPLVRTTIFIFIDFFSRPFSLFFLFFCAYNSGGLSELPCCSLLSDKALPPDDHSFFPPPIFARNLYLIFKPKVLPTSDNPLIVHLVDARTNTRIHSIYGPPL